jgi:F0F1-type ATP synthase assembly protein I
MSEPQQEDKDAKQPRGRAGAAAKVGVAGPLFGAGVQMAAGIVVMFFLGKWLDAKWGTTPWLMLAGILFGCAAGMTQFVRAANSASRQEDLASRDAKRSGSDKEL